MLPLVQPVQPAHLFRRERKVVYLRIRPDAFRRVGFRERDEPFGVRIAVRISGSRWVRARGWHLPVLQRPSDQDLRPCFADFLHDLGQDGIVTALPLCERAISLNSDTALLAIFDNVFLL